MFAFLALGQIIDGPDKIGMPPADCSSIGVFLRKPTRLAKPIRLVSIATIENRKIVRWWDYMDSRATRTD